MIPELMADAIAGNAFLAPTPTFVTQTKYMTLLPLEARGDRMRGIPLSMAPFTKGPNDTNSFNIAKRDIRSVSMPMLSHVRRGTFRPLMALLTEVRRPTPHQKGRRTKHLFDWMAHAVNLAKKRISRTPQTRSLSLCLL